MTKYKISLLLFAFLFCLSGNAQDARNRLIVLADMGNEPDEEQQIVHLMMYANEFDLEGLIAVTGKSLNPGNADPYRRVLHPELFHGIVDGYEKVVENLKKHANGWPDPDYLRSIIVNGQIGYGIESTGKGKSTEGSELILKSLTNPDPRPVYIVVNAGSNTLAQALIDYQSGHSEKEFNELIKKLRVFENGAQDNAGAWICSKFPDIHWIRSNYQTYCYGGPVFESEKGSKNSEANLGPHTWHPYAYSPIGQHQWALENLICNHGALGQKYPLRMFGNGVLAFLEGGGTIPWLGLVHQGLSDINHPDWGGWSGRYTGEKVKNVWSKHESVRKDEVNYGDFYVFTEAIDHWQNPETDSIYHNNYAPVWRWRQAYFSSIKCRMDWCVEKFENANHKPVAAVNGDKKELIHIMKVEPGAPIKFDASESSDPDGDSLQYSWWIYSEAGTYPKQLQIEKPDQPMVLFTVPKDAAGTSIHVILEVKDLNQIARLSDYRRIVLDVQ